MTDLATHITPTLIGGVITISPDALPAIAEAVGKIRTA
jgi:hypothetical protein